MHKQHFWKIGVLKANSLFAIEFKFLSKLQQASLKPITYLSKIHALYIHTCMYPYI